MSYTTGFDMVVAITQNTINANFYKLFMEGIIGDYAYYNPDNGGFVTGDKTKAAANMKTANNYLEMNFDAPYTDLIVKADNQGHLDYYSTYFYLPISSGKFVSSGGFSGKQEKDLSNYTVYAKVDLKQMATNDNLTQKFNVHKKTLSKVDGYLKDSIFTVQHLFLDFDNVDLSTGVGALTPSGKVTNNVMFVNVFKSYQNYLSKNKSPYLVGFSVSSSNPKQLNPSIPLFAPTHVDYSTHPYQNVSGDKKDNSGLSTFNYLLMTHHNTAPTNPSAGIFDINWVTKPIDQGAIAISNGMFKSAFVEKIVLPEVLKALGISKAFSNTGNTWSVDYNNSQTVHTTVVIIPYYITKTDEVSCTLSLTTVNGNPALTGSGFFYHKLYIGTAKENDSPFADCWASVKQKFTISIELSAGADGKLAINATTSKDGDAIKKDHKSAVYTLANIMTFGQVIQKALDNINKSFASFENHQFDNLNAEITTGFSTIENTVIMPAPGVFAYKDVNFNDQFDFVGTVSYKDQ